jgi:hypothetical protein
VRTIISAERGGDALAVEGRLNQLALAPPQVAVAERTKPSPGDALELCRGCAPSTVAVVFFLQDVLDRLRMG